MLIFKIFCRDRQFINRLAEDIGVELGQSAVFVETDLLDDVSFIKGKYRKN